MFNIVTTAKTTINITTDISNIIATTNADISLPKK